MMAELQATLFSPSCSLPHTLARRTAASSAAHQQKACCQSVSGLAGRHFISKIDHRLACHHVLSRAQPVCSQPCTSSTSGRVWRTVDGVECVGEIWGSCRYARIGQCGGVGGRRRRKCVRQVRTQVSNISSEEATPAASESPAATNGDTAATGPAPDAVAEPPSSAGGEVVADPPPSTAALSSSDDASEGQRKAPWRPGERKGFVEEMRIRAMKLHTRDQAKEGEKDSQAKPLAQWKPTIKGYIQFLVDSKALHDTMESIIADPSKPMYHRFLNTGLERSEALAKDLEWFTSQGNEIPEPDTAGTTYANYLRELAESNPPAFICHFYNIYFAHSAGGRMIGRKVAEMILDGRELEFYKWGGDLQELLTNVRTQLNEVAQEWSRDEKDKCLTETELSFKYSGEILRLLAS
eukprot:TRINITY_DN881_c0_g1_i10.p1 TRINITY_DN881_c0_g1~~TRINITY_DN881_c0_g1_i10.p1  ORF type:complete len:409 (-),score=77.82 TRINITY_DN881_c0_g1_i10:400-1626(-)